MFSFFTNSKKVAELESKINDLNSLIEMLSAKIEHDLPTTVSEIVAEKIQEYDFSDVVSEAVSNIDISEQVQEAIEDSFRHATISVDF
jgi:hypothetical protein